MIPLATEHASLSYFVLKSLALNRQMKCMLGMLSLACCTKVDTWMHHGVAPIGTDVVHCIALHPANLLTFN